MAIVTGGTRGIGRAIALELARRGADIAFNYAKSAEAAETLKAELESLGVRVLSVQCDVANTEAAAEMVKQVKDTFERIDFLINNAGITRDNLILRMKEDEWDEVLNTNLKGSWNFAKAALRTMLRQDTGGSILNISSISGEIGHGRTVELFRVESGNGWSDESVGEGSCEPQDYGERVGAGHGRDRHGREARRNLPGRKFASRFRSDVSRSPMKSRALRRFCCLTTRATLPAR